MAACVWDVGRERSAPAPRVPEWADVCVIGAGIAGASCAFHLARLRPGARVLVLDARDAAGGATGRNGGHMKASVFLDEAAAVHGRAVAAELLAHEHRNCAMVRDVVAAHGIECDLSDTTALKVCDSAAELAAAAASARRGCAALPARCPASVEVWDGRRVAEATGFVDSAGGVAWRPAATLHPGKLVDGLLRAASRRCPGLRFAAHTQALRVESSSDGTQRVVTPLGTVRCGKVVVCTNAAAPLLLPALRSAIRPARAQALVAVSPTGAVPRWPCSVSHARGYAFMRPNGAIVAGGARELAPGAEVGVTDDSRVDGTVGRALRAWLAPLSPLYPLRVTHEWAGILGRSADGLPWVGPLPPAVAPPGTVICAGFTGHGMAHAFLAAQTAAEMALGREPTTSVDAFLPTAARLAAAGAEGGSGPPAKL